MTATNSDIKIFTSILDCARDSQTSEGRSRLDTSAHQIELERLLKEATYVDDLLRALFPSGALKDVTCIDAIYEFLIHSTDYKSSSKLYEAVLARLFQIHSSETVQSILAGIPTNSCNHFWQHIDSFRFTLHKIKLSPSFLAEWFIACVKRDGDSAGNTFQLVIDYVIQNPDVGLSVLQHYATSNLEKDRLTLSHVILGSIRCSPNLTECVAAQLRELDLSFSESNRTDYRICFHRSWNTTFRHQPFDAERLSQRLIVMLAGTDEEVTSAFLVLSRSAYHFANNDTALSFAIEWLEANTNTRISSEAKYHVAWLLYRLLTFDVIKPTSTLVLKLLKIVLLISPVPLQNKGTWELLLTFSVRCIPHCTPSEFTAYWTSLVQQSPDKLLIEDLEHNSDTMFWHYAKESGNAEVVTRLMFSRDHLARRYGRLFFEKLDISTFTPAVMAESSERLLLITLLEFVWRLREGKLLLRFFLMIAPRMMNCGNELLARFKHEVFRQIVNLPGSLMKSLALASNDYPVFSDPVASAKSYFEKLKSLHDMPINYFHKHEIDSSVRLFNRKFSAVVQKGVAENSLLMAIAGKPVRIIYGTSFANAYGGTLSDDTKPSQFSHSSEWPRLTCIDPDGEALVGIQYLQEIERLSRDECKSEHQ